jgi:hypothetical protein
LATDKFGKHLYGTQSLKAHVSVYDKKELFFGSFDNNSTKLQNINYDCIEQIDYMQSSGQGKINTN